MSNPIRWAIFCSVVGVVVAIMGEPQPLAILTAGAAWLTAAAILARHTDRPRP